MFEGQELADVLQRLQDGRVRVPHRTTLKRAARRLNFLGMLWDRMRWKHDLTVVGAIGIDASDVHDWIFLCTRTDEVYVSSCCSAKDRLDHDYSTSFVSRIEPLATLAHGEASLVNKTHGFFQQTLNTAGSEGLYRFRWSRVGMITDQGVERGLADIPNVHHMEEIAAALQRVEAGDDLPSAEDAEHFFFPRLLHYTGPLHICWNAFKTQIEQGVGWAEYLLVLRAILYVLGKKSVRRRFLALSKVTASQRVLFMNFKKKLVNWKWEYMEEMWQELSACIELFFCVLDRNPKFLEYKL